MRRYIRRNAISAEHSQEKIFFTLYKIETKPSVHYITKAQAIAESITIYKIQYSSST